MLELRSKVRIESSVFPGVAYTIKRLNQLQRIKREVPLADPRARLGELLEQVDKLRKPAQPGGTVPEEDKRKAEDLDRQAGIIFSSEIKPAVIRFGLLAIEGVMLDGEPLTIDDLVQNAGPESEALLDEIYAACEGLSGLSEEQQKNSQSDGTLSAVDHPSPKPTSADPAGETGSFAAGIVTGPILATKG